MRRLRLLLGVLPLLFFVHPAFGVLTFELKTGVPENIATPMYYWKKGWYEARQIWARYKSEPFQEAPYYVYRFGIVDSETHNKWEFEFMHHKLLLKNIPTDTFKSFQISHGYNMMWINRGWQKKYFLIRLGLGLVLAHPEIELANGEREAWVEGTFVGFYFAGVCAQIAIEKKFYIYENFFFDPEIKFTVAQAQVRFPDGYANVPNVAFHFTFGFGYQFGGDRPKDYDPLL